MITINQSQVNQQSDRKWTAEASALGLKPGEWPDFIAVMDSPQSDTGVLFTITARIDEDGTHYYKSGSGVTLVVLND